MSEKRKRGRPPGEGLNDEKPLAMIAELMATVPCGLYAAVKEISQRSPWGDKAGGAEACQRRWLRKWKVGGIGAKLLAAANEQHRRQMAPPAKPLVLDVGGKLDPVWLAAMNKKVAAFQAEMDRISEPARRKMAEMAKAIDAPAMRAMQARMAEFANSPQMKEMERVAAEMQRKIRDLPPAPKFYMPEIIRRP